MKQSKVHSSLIRKALLPALIAFAPALQATTWTGAISTDWSNASNWSDGVPTSLLDALVTQGGETSPIISGGSHQVRQLTVRGNLPSGGRLQVWNGATLNYSSLYIGYSNQIGVVDVWGANTLLNATTSTYVGYFGSEGTLRLREGARLSSGSGVRLDVGTGGSTGRLEINSGASYSGMLAVGGGASGAEGFGYVDVSGSGSFVSGDTAYIGVEAINSGMLGAGNGELTVRDGAALNYNTIALGYVANSFGVLKIGTGGQAGAVNGNIAGGEGYGTVQFNHNESNYVYSGKITGERVRVEFSGPGTTVLTGNNTAVRTSEINDGRLVLESLYGNINVVGGELSGTGSAIDVVLDGGTIALTAENASGNDYLFFERLNWVSGDINVALGDAAINAADGLLRVGYGFNGSSPTGIYHFTFEDDGWVVGETYVLIAFGTTNIDLELFGFTNGNGFDGEFAMAGNKLTFTLTAIPEPATYALIAGAALLGLVCLRRRS